jgi:hypothetical protein
MSSVTTISLTTCLGTSGLYFAINPRTVVSVGADMAQYWIYFTESVIFFPRDYDPNPEAVALPGDSVTLNLMPQGGVPIPAYVPVKLPFNSFAVASIDNLDSLSTITGYIVGPLPVATKYGVLSLP